jgi:2-deoxy-D-gluconate 3-dehydrogenase
MAHALMDLTGRVAVVTGGNGGIGLGMAEGLVSAGATVVLAGRDAAKGAAAAAHLGPAAVFHQADVTDKQAVLALVEAVRQAHGRLDILVNNAGMNIRKQPQYYEDTEWLAILQTNLTAAFIAARAVYPVMRQGGGGKIINIGSMMSIFGASFSAPYAASKGGIVQMSRALATAWAKDNIQVNAILPGWIDTALTRGARRDVPGLHDSVLARTPAQRWGRPEDFRGIAVFLAGPGSDFVTGTAIPVDGGYSVQG